VVATVFLGVDGGGTKTAFCLLDGDGNRRAAIETRSCYYFAAGIGLVAEVMQEGVSQVCDAAGLAPADIAFAFFGLPSYGEVAGDVAALDEAPAAALGHRRYRCDNDMVCGWAGSLAMADGINVIAGTGSMTYGENRGRKARCGGWGEIFGDEGSAYWIAIRGLGAFTKMSDGRLPEGPLLALMRQRLALTDDLDVVDIVLNRWKGERGPIAALSRTVAEAAKAGDDACEAILRAAADELALVVEATRRRLGFGEEERVPVSYSGGVFSAGAALTNRFRSGLDLAPGAYELRQPLFSPVVGAALYAASLAGTPLGPAALDHLKKTTSRG
jgi:N-acetylglucosamine kinase-like BadF-type ATPase